LCTAPILPPPLPACRPHRPHRQPAGCGSLAGRFDVDCQAFASRAREHSCSLRFRPSPRSSR
jgi:hypothetical protein